MSAQGGQLAKLSQDMYDSYGFTEKTGMDFFRDFASDLSQVEPIPAIIYQMKNYPHRYVMDFLLASPFLWREFRSIDWLNLMRMASPRPDPARCNDGMSAYCDIEFLSRFVGINALDVFVDHASTQIDKLHALAYFRKFPDLLISTKDDAADLDGQYFVSDDELVALRRRIVGEGVFAKKPSQSVFPAESSGDSR